MKKKYAIMLFVFFLAAAVCTYISGQIYQYRLPSVTVGKTTAVEMKYHWDLTGTVRYQETWSYQTPVALEIIETSVSPGEWVNEGDALFLADEEKLYEEWLKCKIQEQNIIEQLSVSTSYEKKLLLRTRELLKDTISQIENLRDAGGWVYAGTDGIVLTAIKSGITAENTEIIRIGSAGASKEFVFYLSDEQSAYCYPDTVLNVKIQEEQGITEKKLEVERVYYNAETGCYCAVSHTDDPLSVMDGQQVTTVLSATGGNYTNVIPVSAIISNNNKNVTFYILRSKEGILGTEYYVTETSAYAVAQNDLYAALSSEFPETIVYSWEKPLTNGQVVKVAASEITP